jgi:hypothetical protein
MLIEAAASLVVLTHETIETAALVTPAHTCPPGRDIK